jgi:PKD repeat protein
MKPIKSVIFCFLMLIHSLGITQNLTQAEYFFNVDPGVGNGTALSITSGQGINTTFNISTQDLNPGFHNLFIRFKNVNGKWGLSEGRTIYVQPPIDQQPLPLLSACEYFFDTDPGIGNGTPTSFAPGQQASFTTTVSTIGLDPGFHTIFIRFRDENGEYGLYEGRTIYIQPIIELMPPPLLSEAEYFFDEDPGIGNGDEISFEGGFINSFTEELPFEGLEPGFHTLFIRIKDQSGNWGLYEGRTFYISDPADYQTIAMLTSAEYFFNEDPGLGGGVPIDFPAAQNVNLIEQMPLGDLEEGNHLLFIRFRNENGLWGLAETRSFVVGACNYPSADFSFEDACVNTEITFTDLTQNTEEGVTYTWDIGNNGSIDYNTVGSISHTFTEPGTWPVKLEVINPGGCSSVVIHEIEIFPEPEEPTINIEGDPEICQGQSIIMWIPDIYHSYWWSNGAEISEIEIEEPGSFFVVVINEFGCSAQSESVFISMHPVYNVTDQQNICEGEVYYFGNQQLTDPGEYTEVFQTTMGCDSTVVLTLFITIVDVSLTIGDLTITANAENATFQWVDCNNNYAPIDGETNQSFTPTEDGYYAVEVTQDGCNALSECVRIMGVGIKEMSQSSEISIFPNPAGEEVNIEGDLITRVTIFNNLGQKKFEKEYLLEKRVKIKTQNLKEGLYIIKVETPHAIRAKKLSIIH